MFRVHHRQCQILQMFFEELHIPSRRDILQKLCQIYQHVCEETDEKDPDHAMVVPMSDGTELQPFLQRSDEFLCDIPLFVQPEDFLRLSIHAAFQDEEPLKAVDVRVLNILQRALQTGDELHPSFIRG
jgi:hypothetical protein